MMGTIIFIAAIIALPFFIYFLMSLMAATARVWRGGENEAREFALAQVDLGAFLAGKVDRQDSSSLIPTRAGIRIRATQDGHFVVAETRTISKDVF
jgi:hypothetical protein